MRRPIQNIAAVLVLSLLGVVIAGVSVLIARGTWLILDLAVGAPAFSIAVGIGAGCLFGLYAIDRATDNGLADWLLA